MKIKILVIALLFAFAVGCKTQKQVVEVPIQYKEKVVERLVPYAVAADSSAIQALFKCDSLNNVVMTQLIEEKGKAQSAVSFQDGKLSYKLIRKVDTIYVKAKDSVIYKEVAVKVEVEKEVNRLTKWQAFQIIFNRILFFMIAAYALWHYRNPISIAFKSLLKLK